MDAELPQLKHFSSMTPRPVTIVGGGLAGLTLGIKLRRHDIPVTVIEAGHYPRHKVCGEFISGRGLGVWDDLGLRDKIFAAGAREAKTVSFFSSDRAVAEKELLEPAVCLSRFKLDALLAEEFRESGGDLQENHRWTKEFGEGVVRATGRIVSSLVNGWRWFGLKVHARHLPLTTDLEMHFTPRGYVGLCRINADTVNVCGLFRSKTTVPNLSQNWREWLCGTGQSALEKKFHEATFDADSFCSVAGLSIGNTALDQGDEVRLGDTIAMIPPVTGNGMSMAVESADLAAEVLKKYSLGELAWSDGQQIIRNQIKLRFQGRLRRADMLQKLLFSRATRSLLFCTFERHDALWRKVFLLTR